MQAFSGPGITVVAFPLLAAVALVAVTGAIAGSAFPASLCSLTVTHEAIAFTVTAITLDQKCTVTFITNALSIAPAAISGGITVVAFPIAITPGTFQVYFALTIPAFTLRSIS